MDNALVSCLFSNTMSSVGWDVDIKALRHMTYNMSLSRGMKEGGIYRSLTIVVPLIHSNKKLIGSFQFMVRCHRVEYNFDHGYFDYFSC